MEKSSISRQIPHNGTDTESGYQLIHGHRGVPESTKFNNLNSSYCRSIATVV